MNTFDDGFACGILVMVAMWVLGPLASKLYDACVKAREAQKTPEQRRAEEAAAQARMDAVRAKWK
jgi:hypothetical protein